MIISLSDIHLVRKQIAHLLYEVHDPELPGISIVDLGMVIDIDLYEDCWKISLAPTYSGCPAIDVIPILVKESLAQQGFDDIKVEMKISPPWSTDWISEKGKQKLFQYGIAPPNKLSRLEDHDGRPKACPQCGSTETVLISRFGSTPCKASYRCETCKEPFEYFKCF